MSKIDYSKFEDKTRCGYGWEVIVPEDGLIRVLDDIYALVTEEGTVETWISKSIHDVLPTELNLVLRKEEWRAGWRPSDGGIKYFTVNSVKGPSNATWCDDEIDERRAAIGNCYPDTPRGKLLAEARAKYEPLIGEIAGMDEPEAMFQWLRGEISGSMLPPNPLVRLAQLETGPCYHAAIRWLDSGYRLTIEEAES